MKKPVLIGRGCGFPEAEATGGSVTRPLPDPPQPIPPLPDGYWATLWRLGDGLSGAPEDPAGAERFAALLSPSTRRYLEAWVLPPRELGPLPWRPIQIWRKFGLLDHTSNRVRFVAAHLLR